MMTLSITPDILAWSGARRDANRFVQAVVCPIATAFARIGMRVHITRSTLTIWPDMRRVPTTPEMQAWMDAWHAGGHAEPTTFEVPSC